MSAKTTGKPPRGTPIYHRLTKEKRSILWALKREGCSQTRMARRLGVSTFTVSRELGRNASHWGYRYQFADAQAKARASAKATKRRKFTDAMWEWAMARLGRGWSFGVICDRAGREGVPMACAETLYAEY